MLIYCLIESIKPTFYCNRNNDNDQYYNSDDCNDQRQLWQSQIVFNFLQTFKFFHHMLRFSCVEDFLKAWDESFICSFQVNWRHSAILPFLSWRFSKLSWLAIIRLILSCILSLTTSTSCNICCSFVGGLELTTCKSKIDHRMDSNQTYLIVFQKKNDLQNR